MDGKTFCKNANQMQLLRIRSIEDEVSMKKDTVEKIWFISITNGYYVERNGPQR